MNPLTKLLRGAMLAVLIVAGRATPEAPAPRVDGHAAGRLPRDNNDQL